jgi:hypothetical protein
MRKRAAVAQRIRIAGFAAFFGALALLMASACNFQQRINTTTV